MTKHAIITITADADLLLRNWPDADYAAQAGKTTNARITDDGWAQAEGWRFHPSCFEILHHWEM
jgi:hypothetical protein